MSRSDPRHGRAFRQRLALARAALGFERLWPALWPALAVLSGFLIVSLLGLWSWLPGWLHALGLAGVRGRPGVGAWRAPAARCAGPTRRAGSAAWSRSTGCRISRCARSTTACPAAGAIPATLLLWRRHQERLERMLHGLKIGLPRSDLPRRDPWALRAALLLLLVVALVEAGSMAPQRLVQAFELDRPGRRRRGAGRADLVGHAADLHRAAADPARGRARRDRPAADDPAAARACRPAARRWPSCIIWQTLRSSSA